LLIVINPLPQLLSLGAVFPGLSRANDSQNSPDSLIADTYSTIDSKSCLLLSIPIE